MTIYAAPGGTLEAGLDYGVSGLVGTIRITITDTPTGAVFLASTTVGITESGTRGVYFWTGTGPSTAGTYTVFWDLGSDAATIGSEDLVVSYTAVVASTPLGTDLCSVADVRADLTIDAGTNTSWDSLIQTYITAATDAIKRETGREFTTNWPNATPRRFRWTGTDTLDLEFCDLQSTTLVQLNPETSSPYTMTLDVDYFLEPTPNPDGVYTEITLSGYLAPKITSTTFIRSGAAYIDVTGVWGFPTIPAAVKQACVTTAASWLRRDHSYAIDGSDDPRGMDPDRPANFGIPPSARRLLAVYRRSFAA